MDGMVPEEEVGAELEGEVAEEDFEAALAAMGEGEELLAEDGECEDGLEEGEAVEEGAEDGEFVDEELAASLEADEQLLDGGAEEEAEDDQDAEEEKGDTEGIEEHLKESIEGSMRMKRMLCRDEEEDSGKKRKLTPEQAEQKEKHDQLLVKWNQGHDPVVRHVLDSLSVAETDSLIKGGFTAQSNQHKSAGELLQRYVVDMRERSSPGGAQLDAVSTFRFRWKLPTDTDKVLRGLSHKDLRYVLREYDGSLSLDELVTQAADNNPEEICTENILSNEKGVPTIGRFSRLELIDPVADAAVFGDANLTFSLRLAKHRKALGHVGRVIATTFEDLPTLRGRYKEIDDIIAELEGHFAEVYHGVDCTRIALDPQFKGMEGKLGAVYYNFPHSGAVGGFFDGHPMVNWRHENLMRLFFRALRTFVKPGGVVKVASNMSAVGVRYSYIVGGATENEFVHVETMPFLEWHLHRYGRSYGDRRDAYKRPDSQNNQSYNAQRAEADMVYCFCYAPSDRPMGQQLVRLPPSLSTLKGCNDGPFGSLMGVAKDNLAKQLHSRFMTECSGTHVG